MIICFVILGIRKFKKCFDSRTQTLIGDLIYGFPHNNLIIEYAWVEDCITDKERKALRKKDLDEESKAILSLFMKDDHSFFTLLDAFDEFGPQRILDMLSVDSAGKRLSYF